MNMDAEVVELGRLLAQKNLCLACAESCTGGLAAHTLTNVSGSSDWFTGGIVAYANEVKRNLLNVDETVLSQYGAVSEPVVLALAENICRVLDADVGFGISGVAGPTGGTPDKPVGTVWIGWHLRREGETWARCHAFSGSRLEIKEQSVDAAITGLLQALGNRRRA